MSCPQFWNNNNNNTKMCCCVINSVIFKIWVLTKIIVPKVHSKIKKPPPVALGW
jgi:hypothetical protein